MFMKMQCLPADDARLAGRPEILDSSIRAERGSASRCGVCVAGDQPCLRTVQMRTLLIGSRSRSRAYSGRIVRALASHRKARCFLSLGHKQLLVKSSASLANLPNIWVTARPGATDCPCCTDAQISPRAAARQVPPRVRNLLR